MMSIFIPYDVDKVVSYFTSLFSLDLTSLTSFESLLLTILSNAYFFVFWFFIIYFSLKIFNRIYERMF